MSSQPTLQSVFDRTQKTKAEIKTIKAMVRDALKNSNPYQNMLEELETVKARAKSAKEAILSDFKSDLDRLDTLQSDLKNDMALMSDIALDMYVRGESIEVFDKNENKYQPALKLVFKKICAA